MPGHRGGLRGVGSRLDGGAHRACRRGIACHFGFENLFEFADQRRIVGGRGRGAYLGDAGHGPLDDLSGGCLRGCGYGGLLGQNALAVLLQKVLHASLRRRLRLYLLYGGDRLGDRRAGRHGAGGRFVIARIEHLAHGRHTFRRGSGTAFRRNRSGARGDGRFGNFGGRLVDDGCGLGALDFLHRLFGRFGGSRDDARFDDDIGRPADHDEVFHIVAAHQNEAAARVDGGGVQHGKARGAVASAANEGRGGPAANDPQHQREAEKAEQHHRRGNDEFRAVLSENLWEHGAVTPCRLVAVRHIGDI